MKENIIKIKSFDFALKIVKLNPYLIDERREYVLLKQILKSGTSIGANIREGEPAQSKSDFIHKLSISVKEANEKVYWLDLLFLGNYKKEMVYNSLKKEGNELLKLFTSIIKNSKKISNHWQ